MRIPLILIVILGFNSLNGQNRNIAEIESTKEAEKLVQSLYPFLANYKVHEYKKYHRYFGSKRFCQNIFDELNINKLFFKSDFDKNGLIDMVVSGEIRGDQLIYVVLSHKDDSLQLLKINSRNETCAIPEVIDDTFYYFQLKESPYFNRPRQTPELNKKTLVYKFGHFIEQNNNPEKYNIQKIELSTSKCFGTCSKFVLTIDKDTSATYINHGYLRGEIDLNESYKTQIDTNTYNKIFTLLKYIDFPNLKQYYGVNWTDDQTVYLKITYNDGQTKEIEDYGRKGTYGLQMLYGIMFNLRRNQNWIYTN